MPGPRIAAKVAHKKAECKQSGGCRRTYDIYIILITGITYGSLAAVENRLNPYPGR